MSNRYLLPVYEEIFDEPFEYGNFEKRLKMQKAIYLLQEMGVPISDYSFSWYKHGPYSQTLLDDMHLITPSESAHTLVNLTKDNFAAINKLKDAVQGRPQSGYTGEKWIEGLASIHFLRKNLPSRSQDDQKILDELVERKPHLNDRATNQKALECIDFLFA